MITQETKSTQLTTIPFRGFYATEYMNDETYNKYDALMKEHDVY